jgi:formiminotetrahydrofolate cyclodeaminase
MSSLSRQTIADYLAALASKAPTPGGGAAVGVTAAQAAALLGMALQVTGPLAWGETGAALEMELAKARVRFLDLAEDDARAFDAVMAAFRMKKDDPARAATLEHALKEATRVPLDAMRSLAALYPAARSILTQVKRHVVSDVGVAVRFADAALAASAYTVRINLDSLEDDAFVARTRHELRELLERSRESSAELLRSVDTALGG